MTLRRVPLDACLWGLVFAGLVLPALIAVGSPLFGTVSLVVLVVGLSVGLALAFLAPLGTVRSALLCAVLVWFYAYFYHWELLVSLPAWLLTSVGAAFVACILLRRKVLAILAIALVAGATGAEIERPPLATVYDYPDTASPSQAPTVIHLLLDEFGSPAGLPEDVFTAKEREAYADFYVKKGFRLYEGALSADERTWQSVPRILNFGPKNLDSLVDQRELYDAVIKRAAAFEHVSRRRRLHVVASEFIDLSDAVTHVPSLASFKRYRTEGFSFDRVASRISFADRLKMTFSQVSESIEKRQVPLYVRFLRDTELGKKIQSATKMAKLAHPLTTKRLLSRLGVMIREKGQRGEYYFAHLLLPHYPYIFETDCRVRPTEDWLASDARPDVDTMQTRARRYRLYYEQVFCMNSLIDEFLATIKQNPALSDAVVIIHGDHGSRISLREPEMWVGTGYNENDYRRDWHSTFFAVRIPGKPGGLSSEAALLHDLYKDLVMSDFKEMPLTSTSVATE